MHPIKQISDLSLAVNSSYILRVERELYIMRYALYNPMSLEFHQRYTFIKKDTFVTCFNDLVCLFYIPKTFFDNVIHNEKWLYQ